MSQEQNQKMMEWSTAWLLDGDLCRCRKCKRGIVMSRSAESFIHASGCSQAHLDSPWRDLQALFTPPPSTEPAPQDTGEFGEPWQIAPEIDGVMAGRNTWIKSSRGKQVAATYNQTRPAAQNRKDECEKYAARITDCVNLLAGHDLSQVVVVKKEVFNELLAAVSDIVKPLGDETETSGNPCCSPSPAQGRRIAAALASLNKSEQP